MVAKTKEVGWIGGEVTDEGLSSKGRGSNEALPSTEDPPKIKMEHHHHYVSRSRDQKRRLNSEPVLEKL